MPAQRLASDPRYLQLSFQLLFMSYGLIYLGWTADWKHYVISIGGTVLFNYSAELLRQQKGLVRSGIPSWLLSALISGMSLCLLLKTGHWYTSLLATLLTVASKYLLRVGSRHIFNPSAFGIIATLLITRDAWLSPGQWGSSAVLFFVILLLGTIVVTRAQKLDASLGFLLTFLLLTWWRQIYVLGWPMDYFLHSMTTGSLLIFSFFMISDPRTAPAHPMARVLWASLIAIVSFYLTAFQWKYNTSIWVLVGAAPLVPLLDKLFLLLKKTSYDNKYEKSISRSDPYHYDRP